MTQTRLAFGGVRRRWDCKPADLDATWPQIIAGDPDRYPSRLMQQLAALALHRAGHTHRADLCLRCIEHRKAEAAW